MHYLFDAYLTCCESFTNKNLIETNGYIVVEGIGKRFLLIEALMIVKREFYLTQAVFTGKNLAAWKSEVMSSYEHMMNLAN